MKYWLHKNKSDIFTRCTHRKSAVLQTVWRGDGLIQSPGWSNRVQELTFVSNSICFFPTDRKKWEKMTCCIGCVILKAVPSWEIFFAYSLYYSLQSFPRAEFQVCWVYAALKGLYRWRRIILARLNQKRLIIVLLLYEVLSSLKCRCLRRLSCTNEWWSYWGHPVSWMLLISFRK